MDKYSPENYVKLMTEFGLKIGLSREESQDRLQQFLVNSLMCLDDVVRVSVETRDVAHEMDLKERFLN